MLTQNEIAMVSVIVAAIVTTILMLVSWFDDANWKRQLQEQATASPAVVNTPPPPAPLPAPPRPVLYQPRQHYRRRDGYVYVIQDVDVTGFYKIGRTANTARRFGDFAAKWPFKWAVIHTIETDDCPALETDLHRQYADKRVRGEWFALDDDDIAAIRRLA